MTSKERRRGAPNLRGALAYVFPEGFILAAGVAYTHSRWLQNALGGFQDFFPYAMLGAGLLLGWRFQRSRLLFALLVLLIAHRVLTHLATGHGLGRDHVLYQAIGVLLPLNLAALSLTAERGFLTPPGLVRNGTILVQVLLVSWLDAAEPAATGALLHLRLMPQKLFAWTPLADPALLSFLLSLALLIAGQLLAPNAARRAFIWPTVAAVLLAHPPPPGQP